jgi:hypothetical protein
MARILQQRTVEQNTEPEFLNIYCRLKSRLFEKSSLFKGQRVQQGSYRLQFLYADRKMLFRVNFTKIENWSKCLYILILSEEILRKLNCNPALTLSAELHFKMLKNSGSGGVPLVF